MLARSATACDRERNLGRCAIGRRPARLFGCEQSPLDVTGHVADADILGVIKVDLDGRLAERAKPLLALRRIRPGADQ